MDRFFFFLQDTFILFSLFLLPLRVKVSMLLSEPQVFQHVLSGIYRREGVSSTLRFHDEEPGDSWELAACPMLLSPLSSLWQLTLRKSAAPRLHSRFQVISCWFPTTISRWSQTSLFLWSPERLVLAPGCLFPPGGPQAHQQAHQTRASRLWMDEIRGKHIWSVS